MSGGDWVDFYALLGVSSSADTEQIKRAYRQLAKNHHPDKVGDGGQIVLINEAYETLKDPKKRAKYDEQYTLRGGAMTMTAQTIAQKVVQKIANDLKNSQVFQKNLKKFEQQGRKMRQFAHQHWRDCAKILQKSIKNAQKTTLPTLVVPHKIAHDGGEVWFDYQGRAVCVILPKRLQHGSSIRLLMDGESVWFRVAIDTLNTK